MKDAYYSYDTCTVNVEFSGIPTIRPPGNDGKEKIVATGSSSGGSELQRYKGDLNLCTTKVSDVEVYLDSRYDAVEDVKISGLSTTPILWGIYMVFWMIQITKIWKKSSMIIAD